MVEGKKYSSTEVRTQAKGFKVLCANHYTIELPITPLLKFFLTLYTNRNWVWLASDKKRAMRERLFGISFLNNRNLINSIDTIINGLIFLY